MSLLINLVESLSFLLLAALVVTVVAPWLDQRPILRQVAINLVLILLFPPFEYYYAISKAALPSFDGFYFVFDDNRQRQIVATLLAYGVFLGVLVVALPLRAWWLRRLNV